VKEERNPTELGHNTIFDFGEQWTHNPDNKGYYGSLELFDDFFQPFITRKDINGKQIGDIGSGTGRIVHMLLEAGASHVWAVEPSPDAFKILTRNLHAQVNRVSCLNSTGENLNLQEKLDMVFSVGVLHHIPDPRPTMRAAYNALKPGGKIAIWIYSKEVNSLFLQMLKTLRYLTVKLPHHWLSPLCYVLEYPLKYYIRLCRLFPLPLKQYMTNVLNKLTADQRRLMIYDQLNPSYAKYYMRNEVIELLEKAGFGNIQIRNRHNYSWTAIATKPH